VLFLITRKKIQEKSQGPIIKRRFLFILVCALICSSFFSQAQYMFYHLLGSAIDPYTWIGLGVDANWTTPANWYGGQAPGLSNVAIFDNNCISNCNPTIDAAISIRGVNLKSTYAGTVTQGAGNTITIGSSGWNQAGGFFSGGNSAVTMNGPFSLSGGTYTATSGTWTQSANFTISGSPIFNHNSGNWVSNSNITLIGNGITLNTVSFGGYGISVNFGGSTLKVSGTLSLDDTYSSGTQALSNGTVEIHSDLVITNYGKRGSAVLKFVGTGAQVITGGANAHLPAVEINKSSGTLTLTSKLITYANWSWINGSVDASTSQLVFSGNASSAVITPGPVDYNDVTFTGYQGAHSLSSGTLKVLGTLVLDDTYASGGNNINSGNIEAYGNIILTNYGKRGSAVLKIVGMGTQSLTGSAAAFFPNIEINKGSGILNLISTMTTYGNWSWLSGAVDAGTSLLIFSGNSSSAVIVPGAINYANVTFTGYQGTHNLSAGTMNVSGILTFSDGYSSTGKDVNNGTLSASGNVVFSSYGKTGTAVLNFIGTTATTLSLGATASSLSTTHVVAKTGAGKVSLVANTSYAAAGRNFAISSGTLDVSGFAFSVNNLLSISSGGRLICSGGTATAGSWSVLGEISCGSGQGITWTGAAADNLWSSSGNWTNNTIPGASDIAIFNNSVCVGANCDAQINSNLSVRGINMMANYLGVLTQNASRTLTIGAGNYLQAGGTFSGGDSGITSNGAWALSGGTFTSTSQTLRFNSNMTVTGAPVFSHNNGTIEFYNSIATTSITPGSVVLNNVSLLGYQGSFTLSGILTVDGLLTIADSHPSFVGSVNGGTISARGDVVIAGLGKDGSANLQIAGTGNQTIMGGGTSARIFNTQIISTGGIVTMVGVILFIKNYTYTSGVLDPGASTLYFYNNNSTNLITPGTIAYNNVTFSGYQGNFTLSGTFTVNGLLTINDSHPTYVGSVNGGTIIALGDVAITGLGKDGSATLQIAGTGHQTITGSGSAARLFNTQIISTGGIVTLAGTMVFNKNFTYASGAVDAGTSTVYFYNVYSTTTITPGSIAFNNVTFSGTQPNFTLSGTLIVNGQLVLAESNVSYAGTINGGTISARGDVAITGLGKDGSATLQLAGTGNQTFTGGGSSARVFNTEIISTGGTVTLVGVILFIKNYTYTSGVIDPGTSTMYFYNSNTTTTITPGSVAYNNVTFGGNSSDFNLSGTMTVNGTLTFADSNSSASANVNSGSFEANGNIVFSNYGSNGTATITAAGGTSSNYTLAATTSKITSGQITVNKSGGSSLLLGSDVALVSGQDLQISLGTLDLNGYDLTNLDVLNVGAGSTLKCSGGIFGSVSLVNNGTINCPGYSTYDFNWTGAGGNSNWDTVGNWQSGSIPTTSDVAYFDAAYCGTNCNVTLNVDPNARGVLVAASYSGTLTQSAGVAMTLGKRGWIQSSGTFVGNGADVSLDGGLTVTGGNYQMTSGTTTVGTTTCSTKTMLNYTGGTLSHNNGRFKLAHRRGSGISCSAVANFSFPNGFTLNDFETQGDYASGWTNTANATNGNQMNILGNYYDYGHTVNWNIDLSGNLFVNKTNPASTSAYVRFSGAGAQEYSFAGSTVANKIIVFKTSGVVQPALGNINFSVFAFDLNQGSFVAPPSVFQVGTDISSTLSMTLFNVATGTVFSHNGGTTRFAFTRCSVCTANATGTISVPAGFDFYNVEVWGQPQSSTWTATISSGGGSINVLNDFIHNGAKLNSNWSIQGQVVVGPYANGGSGTITLNGTGAQSITAYPGSFASEGTWTVNKLTGAVTMNGAGLKLSGTGQDFNLMSGTLNLNSAILNVKDQFNIGTGTTVNCENGFYIAGVFNNSGTLNCGSNYVKSVLTTGSGPKAYWRMSEPDSTYPMGDSAALGTYIGTSLIPSGSITYGVDRSTNLFMDKSLTISGNANIDIPASVPLGANYTLELWFNYPLPAGKDWNTFFRGFGATGDHHILVQRTTL
jgi:hypothetical protein